MVDVDRKANMISSDMPKKSPRLSNKLEVSAPAPPPPLRVADLKPASESACSAYEHYIRLPELKKLCESKEFPGWQNESILKPALQGLELTFRFISTVLYDPRPYTNRREWERRLQSLATSQVEIIALLCENENENEDEDEDSQTQGTAPTTESRTSETSLLPRLATWQKSEDVAQKIMYTIECEMRRCPYTLGLGEPNITRKPTLNYDLICKPLKLHSLKQSPCDQINLYNYENQTLYTIHQLLETWIYVSKPLLEKLVSRIGLKDFEKAAGDCWLLEKIWKLFTDIEDLHLLMDPDDFLRLKNQLSIKATSESQLFCFRSKGLIEITRLSKDLRHKVPEILDAEVDPRGGPRIQEAAMRLYRRKEGYGRIHLLQALQAVEMAVKKFYYSYKQLLVIVIGSLEANGNKGFGIVESGDLLEQIFLEPTYYPSLDAAKTFLGYCWTHDQRGRYSPERRCRGRH